jgi:hypothetical protein
MEIVCFSLYVKEWVPAINPGPDVINRTKPFIDEQGFYVLKDEG